MKLSQLCTFYKIKGVSRKEALKKLKKKFKEINLVWDNGHQKIFNTVYKMEKQHGADWAISDIHGCYKTFMALLKKIGYNSEMNLYLLGDYIDRGRDSKKVLDWIMKHKCYPLLGNHDKMLLDCQNDPKAESFWIARNGGEATLKSFGVNRLKDVDKKYINFVKKLPACIKLKDFVLVHGGINFKRPNPFAITDTNIEHMVWDRNGEEDTKVKMIVGHTPNGLKTIVKSLNSNKVKIDGGCAYGNYLVAFNLDSKSIVVQKNIEKD